MTALEVRLAAALAEANWAAPRLEWRELLDEHARRRAAVEDWDVLLVGAGRKGRGDE